MSMAQNSNLIIIDITDYENIILDGSSNLKEIKGNGKLVIKNPSQRSRLWNLVCDLKENMDTSLDELVLNVGTLNPSQEFPKEYDIKELKQPCLKVEEIFDTETSDPDTINNAFLYQNDNKGKLTLSIENTLDLPILDIKITRDIPDFIQEIEMTKPNFGELSLKSEGDKRILSWEIPSLDGKGKAELELPFNVNVKETGEQLLGALNVKYLIDSYKLCLMNPEIRGATDSLSGIDRDEGSTPGVWDCNVEFNNESEFQVKLEDAKVSHKIPTGTENVVSTKPDKVLNPEESWDLDFKIEAKDVPELSSEIVFTPLYVVVLRVIGDITKESTIYTVLSATIDKEINPPEVDAYANTDMTIVNTIVNTGSSKIEKIFITDIIPNDFIPPLISDISIKLADIDITEREEYMRGMSITPNDQRPDSQHQIICELSSLQGEFLPEKKLIISYPLKARNPRPPTETTYMTPIKIEINCPVEGKLFIKSPDEEPELKVKYVKRKLKTLKSIKPGMTEGEFSISVRVQNKGEVELENLLIKDLIPSGFTITEFNPPEGSTHEIAGAMGKSELQVKFDEIKGGAAVNIRYTCTGTGDYPRTEPNVIVLRRDAADEEKPTDTGVQAAPITDGTLEASVHDIFLELYKILDEAPSGLKLGNFLEEKRDSLPPGPVLHQMLAFAKEMKALGDKIVVGSLKDDALYKLKDFQTKYS